MMFLEEIAERKRNGKRKIYVQLVFSFRVAAIDHGLFSFTDVTHGTWPIILVTNPKHALFAMPLHEPLHLLRESSHIRSVGFIRANVWCKMFDIWFFIRMQITDSYFIIWFIKIFIYDFKCFLYMILNVSEKYSCQDLFLMISFQYFAFSIFCCRSFLLGFPLRC